MRESQRRGLECFLKKARQEKIMAHSARALFFFPAIVQQLRFAIFQSTFENVPNTVF